MRPDTPHKMNATVTLRDLETGDAGWVLEQHARHYLQSDGFGEDFEAVVAETLARFLRRTDRRRERAWIADDGQQRLGCIFLCADDASTARLRLFFVSRAARRRGLGRRLLATVMRTAAQTGSTTLRVATHDSHRAAGLLYAAAGFTLRDSRPVQSFGQALVEQHWEIGLPAPDTLAIAGGRR